MSVFQTSRVFLPVGFEGRKRLDFGMGKRKHREMIVIFHLMTRIFPVMLIALALHFSSGASVSAAEAESIPSTDEPRGGISAVAPPTVSRKLSQGEEVFVGKVQINDPREFVAEVGTGATGAVESTVVRPALKPEQFKGITPQSTVLRIIVQLGQGYVDPMADNGVVMWWCTDGRVLYMQWDWVHLDQPPVKLVWGPNKAI